MNPDQFAQTIKAKYPQYQNVDNATLAKQVVAKYPQYASSVNFNAPATDSSEQNAALPVSSTDNPLAPTSLLKGVVNAIPDAYHFVKGIISQPAETADTIGKIVAPNENTAAPKVSALDVVKNTPEGAIKTLSGLIPDSLKHLLTGHIAQAGRDVENAPVSNIVPVIGGVEGAAGALDSVTGLGEAADAATARNAARAAATVEGPAADGTQGFTMAPEAMEPVPTTFKQNVNNGLSTIASPFTSLLGKAGDAAGSTAASVVGALTGISPEAIKSVFNDPEAFSDAGKLENSRDSLASDLSDAIDKRLEDLRSEGSAYDGIRRDTATQVNVPENFIPSVLSKYGFSLDGDGKIVADSNSLTRSPSDINALQHFVDNWGSKTTMTPNEFLNMRSDIGKMAKFGRDIGSNMDAKAVGKDFYAQANATMRPQIQNLKNLDAVYAPEKEATKALKKEFFTKEGVLKDGVAAKIANATKDGKQATLDRLESIMPGITKRIEILNTVEEINKAKKSGLLHSTIEVGLATPFTGLLPAVISAIVTHPDVAIPIVKGLGLTSAQIGVLTDKLTTIAGKISSQPALTSTALSSKQQKKQ